jgi:hypothetical protein
VLLADVVPAGHKYVGLAAPGLTVEKAREIGRVAGCDLVEHGKEA